MKRVAVILIIFVTLIGCKKPTPTPSLTNNYIGDTIVLKYGECKTLVDSINNNTYELCFLQDTIKDERCPKPDCMKGVCAFLPWKGAEIHIELKEQNNIFIIPIIAHPFSCGNVFPPCDSSSFWNVKDTLGFHFCLISLSPYPDTSNVPINPKDYVAKIKVTRP